MKYGEQFEKESVPQWSLYNIDYNALKHYIKANTTKDQATAIAIPGHHDASLAKFEAELYGELSGQHDRVDLFVKSKADEISRRLQHLSSRIHRLILRGSTPCTNERSLLRHQHRSMRYEHELLRCGDDIRSLQRFVSAQVVAFRKILKKYKKWTGSSALGLRFRDSVLSHPKSFTKHDFSSLQAQYDDLAVTLRAATPMDTSRSVSPVPSPAILYRQPSDPLSPTETIVNSQYSQQPVRYWNEYDHGSEAGDADQNDDTAYTIYVNPDREMDFPGKSALKAVFAVSVGKWMQWTAGWRQPETPDGRDGERGPLLPTRPALYGTADSSYFSSVPGGTWTDTEADDEADQAGGPGRRGSHGSASSEEFPVGYKAHYAALPSIESQRMAQYREYVLSWGTWACFAVSYMLMGIATLLIMTGRHKLRLEVDAGVMVGIMASLGSACAALGMTCSRQDTLSWLNKLAVWSAFTIACVLNGILLVLMLGNTP
ncbi:hypothetical protein B0T22DRAFT_276055 [Podospora appendiculata]|uniref:SPX domain-containing protein n=1 Tax=Podospora appendiculata TaxID=314037 RepID=A0AAE0X067_9PEZI|nr:hypothetical protein B0T22DRAFT_276055 [Podospora appendiculata]